ncbi:[FeFe] hydrogenase, group A [Candidatus Parcubacteria bacterium]|nr:[FeFe] hydrogenase, group A [Candidatus Parcubacteria bacterium]
MKITINKKKVTAAPEETILDVAKKEGIEIPALCFHSDLKIKASCRLCLVEIKGRPGLYTACSTKVEPGMEIVTESVKINKARRINLELIFAQHQEECNDCVMNFNCELLGLARKYKININRFDDRKKGLPVYEFGPSLIFDSSKCIDCGNCIDVCQQQGIGYLEKKEKGNLYRVVPAKNKECIYCGQCLVHCPAGAFEAVGEFEDIAKPLEDKNKVVVFQIAPSIRSSIGEEFGLPHGSVVTEKIVAGIKELGVDKVFDVCVGADITTIEESLELIERLESKKNLPMFTSCCPAWVRFIESYHPELVPNLTTVRSPQIILGGLIKTYWAQQEKIDPERITVVSIMPCVAKKYEITREELNINGLRPVDYVLTTRELAKLFKRKNIDLKNIKPQKIDNPLGLPTGAGVIYGASGGVMESALRTTYKKLTGKKLLKVEFKQIAERTKAAEVKIGNQLIKVATVSGIGNAKKILENNPYDYVEVMACPGGCIGGGGQPMLADEEIRKKRAASLFKIDSRKKIRFADENPIVKKLYQKFLKDKKIVHSICHTKFYEQN